ncbi:hypothetical protein Ancab_001281 [Ancistrocladus abbreviatus]
MGDLLGGGVCADILSVRVCADAARFRGGWAGMWLVVWWVAGVRAMMVAWFWGRCHNFGWRAQGASGSMCAPRVDELRSEVILGIGTCRFGGMVAPVHVYMLGGFHSRHFFWTGVIIRQSQNMGLVTVDRNIVAISASDMMLYFAAFPIEIPQELKRFGSLTLFSERTAGAKESFETYGLCG